MVHKMNIINDNIWNYWNQGYYIIIPTNGTIRNDSALVMGRGLAKQANQKFTGINLILGNLIKLKGNYPFLLKDYKIISFPVKHNWWENANLALIEQSSNLLKQLIIQQNLFNIAMPKVGCGNGKLQWKEVYPIISKYLEDVVTIIDNHDNS